MIGSTLKTFDNTPTRSYGDAMRPYKIPAPHPEMEGIKYGEELLVFHPEEEDDEDEGDGDVPAYVGKTYNQYQNIAKNLPPKNALLRVFLVSVSRTG